MSHLLLPRGYEAGYQVDLIKPDADTIMEVFDKTDSDGIYRGMARLVEGGVSTIDGKEFTFSEALRMPLVSAEVVAVNTFRKYNLPTLVEGVYPCPRCGTNSICEETPDGDTRDDVASLPVINSGVDKTGNPIKGYSYEQDYFVLDLSQYDETMCFTDENGDVDIEIMSLTFRDPTLKDVIDAHNDKTLRTPSERLKKIYRLCMVSAEFVAKDNITFDKLVNRYQYELLAFKNYETIEAITLGLRKYGFQFFKIRSCKRCGKVWEAPVDFTSFFVSALRSRFGDRKSR